MFKKVLFTAALVIASSPAFVSAQEFFWSFDEFSRAPTQTVAPGTTSGTAYIFADANLQFSQLDLDFSVSGPASITGTTTFNDGGSDGSKFSAILAVNQNDQDLPPTATAGRLAAFTLNSPFPPGISNGQQPGDLDADFRPGANAFLLAEVDFNLAGSAGDVANFDLVLSDLLVQDEFDNTISVTLGNAQLSIAAVPEPSSATLLILGVAAMVVRRRRS